MSSHTAFSGLASVLGQTRASAGARALREAVEPFRCECGVIKWRTLAEFNSSGSWDEYEHCGQVMELLGAGEAADLRAKGAVS